MKRLWRFDRTICALLSFVLLLFLLPLRWLGAVTIAALIHELGHYCAVRLLGGSIHSIKIGPTGSVMKASGLTLYAQTLCILAGPVAGLLPLLTIRVFPAIAVCGFIQSAYNILPVYPLDGGRILRNVIQICGGSHRCFRIIENSTLIILALFCIYIRIRFRVSLFLFLMFLLFEKHLANR